MTASKNVVPLLILSAVLSQLCGQTNGEISGSVTDTTGAVIQGATINVRNTATSQVREVQTNQTGAYDVPFLIPGTYVVRVEKQGFRSAVRNDVLLQVGAVVRVDFTVDIGATESVEVQPFCSIDDGNYRSWDRNREPAHVELPDGRNYLQMAPQPKRVRRTGLGR
jgi:hypothetical protein